MRGTSRPTRWGRYSQGISGGEGAGRGAGWQDQNCLQRAIALQPAHTDAHIALGTWHAEVIDKVGALVGGLTYGAKKDASVASFEKASLQLNPTRRSLASNMPTGW